MLGIFLYKMLYNRNPYFISKKGRVEFPDDIKISKDAEDIILKLLEKNPSKRLGSHKGIKEIKKHPFFKSINFDLLQKKEVTAPFIPQLKIDELFCYNIYGSIVLNKLYLKEK